MKTLLVSLTMLLFMPPGWVNNIDALLESAESTLVIEDKIEKIKEKETYTQEYYKGKKYKKYIFTASGKGFFADNETSTYYFYKGKLVKYEGVSKGPIIVKLKSDKSEGVARLTERKQYFKDKTYGMEWTRSIQIKKGESVDSLKAVLQTMKFESSRLSKSDVSSRMSTFQRFLNKGK